MNTYTHTCSEAAIQVGVTAKDQPGTLYLQGTVLGSTPVLQTIWTWTKGMSSNVGNAGLLELAGPLLVYEGTSLVDVVNSLDGVTQVIRLFMTNTRTYRGLPTEFKPRPTPRFSSN